MSDEEGKRFGARERRGGNEIRDKIMELHGLAARRWRAAHERPTREEGGRVQGLHQTERVVVSAITGMVHHPIKPKFALPIRKNVETWRVVSLASSALMLQHMIFVRECLALFV